ncbi:DUF975 family protein [Neobacillus sp. D3-1R]|uniref:DUF975 family protein n=1 Tax=Neobacillus sp. D3-1R TaxID=3445778 RepID=UPI003FA147F1
MSIVEIKRTARRALKGKWGLAVQLTLLVYLITTIFPYLVEVFISGGFSNWWYQKETPIAADLINILVSLAVIPLSVSTYWFYLGVIRSENVSIEKVFSVYKDGTTSFKLIGASFLMGIFVFLWSLLLIIPGIIKAISYSQTFFILKDHPEYSVLEAISESKKRMKGYKWKYLILYISFLGWAILCLFTLGIGLLWLTPYVTASVATFYNEHICTKKEEF